MTMHDETQEMLRDIGKKGNILSEGENEHLMKIEQMSSHVQTQRVAPDSADTSMMGKGRVKVIGTNDFINSKPDGMISPNYFNNAQEPSRLSSTESGNNIKTQRHQQLNAMMR